MPPIKFGTDGWRAIMGEDFIPDNVAKVIQAFCDWRLRIDPAQREVILGYDRRQNSRETAELVASVLAANNFTVQLSSSYCPTPCVSWMTKNSKAFVGIVVTASHNPWEWNGIKFKEDYGGSASPAYTAEIEAQIAANEQSGRHPVKMKYAEALSQKLITLFDPQATYLTGLKNLVDLSTLASSPFKILYDSMHGAGSGFLGEILGDGLTEIHADPQVSLEGVNPEPIDKNLGELLSRMSGGGFALGLATDGDADRIGAVDDRGSFVNSHQIFALLLKHYVQDKGLKGTVVKSVSTSQMINRLCDRYGLKLVETPIGFKHICATLRAEDALMGGEESGGLSFAPHVHERDGLLNGLMLVEMISQHKKGVRELIDDLYAEIGRFDYDRVDLHLERDKINKLLTFLSKEKITRLAGVSVARTNFMDGFKYILSDESWLLIRASGTEPLVRIYAEASSREKVNALLAEGNKLLPA